MSRKNIRLLASGFLFSGLLILILSVFGPEVTDASDTETVEAYEEEIRYLEEVAVSLELENEQLTAENALLSQATEEEADSVSEEDATDTDEDDESDSQESDSSDQDSAEEDEPETEAVESYVVTVNEGEPSSVVATQLESYGLIDDYHEFNQFMEENNLFRQLRPGEYAVQSDMNRQQLIDAIIR